MKVSKFVNYFDLVRLILKDRKLNKLRLITIFAIKKQGKSFLNLHVMNLLKFSKTNYKDFNLPKIIDLPQGFHLKEEL